MWTSTKRLADGSVAYYAYASKGGPLIARGVGATLEAARRALADKLGQPETLNRIAAAREAAAIQPKASIAYISGVVEAYRASPEWKGLAPRTRRDWTRHLDDFKDEFGDWRVRLFEDPRTVQDVAEWRDQLAHSLRQAQMRIETVSRLFSWARSRGVTTANPTEPLDRIYRCDRSDVIWTQPDIEAVTAKASPELRLAIMLAVETGLRQADLIALPWNAVGDVAIIWRTAKRRRDAIIPISPTLRAALKAAPRRAITVLASSHGRPWSSDGLKTAFGRAKAAAGIKGLRWHDFRGTAVTRLAQLNLTARDIARILAWSESRVEGIMARYVSADALALDMLARMRGERPAQTADKPNTGEASQ